MYLSFSPIITTTSGGWLWSSRPSDKIAGGWCSGGSQVSWFWLTEVTLQNFVPIWTLISVSLEALLRFFPFNVRFLKPDFIWVVKFGVVRITMRWKVLNSFHIIHDESIVSYRFWRLSIHPIWIWQAVYERTLAVHLDIGRHFAPRFVVFAIMKHVYLRFLNVFKFAFNHHDIYSTGRNSLWYLTLTCVST